MLFRSLSELIRFHFFLKLRGISTLDYMKKGSNKGPSKVNVQKIKIPKLEKIKDLISIDK